MGDPGREPPWKEAVRVKTTVGFDLYAEPIDWVSRLLVRDSVYEPRETDLMGRLVRAGDTCVDAGCHIGYYSCLLATLVGPTGRVYAFDANPLSCDRTRFNLALNGLDARAEVTHAALGVEREGVASFNVSRDDETGLSSLGEIATKVATITAPWLRLEEFLESRHVHSIRLLKLDIEGAEELALRGLGSRLADHSIDFISLECSDPLLQLLGSSAERLGATLLGAGYSCWEYGVGSPTGWARAESVRSQEATHLFFASPKVSMPEARVTLAGALAHTQTQRQALERQLSVMVSEKADLDNLTQYVRDIESSPAWRVMEAMRKARDRVGPPGTSRRDVLDALVRAFGGRPA